MELLLQKGLLLLEHLVGVVMVPGEGRHPGVLEDPLGLVPVLEGQEHIRTHEEPQLVLREHLMEFLHGVGGVALALPPKLQVRGLCPGTQAVGHEPGHLQTLLRGGGPLRQALVGRLPVGNDDQAVQAQLLHGSPGGLHMSQMGRVKGPAVDSNFHVVFTCSFLRTRSIKQRSG